MLNEEIRNQLTRFMFLPTRVVQADATIVLGMSLWRRPLTVARQLYQAGLAGTLVLSGGFNAKLGACEADEMLTCWQEWGLPGDGVLVDAKATHTRENMLFAKALLEERGCFHPEMIINLVTINYHMCRAVLTLQDVMGPHIRIGTANYVSQYCDPKAWHHDAKGQALILQEARKIKRYFPNMITPCHLLA